MKDLAVHGESLGGEFAVEAAGAHSDDPGRDVGDGAGSGAGVASGTDADNAFADGVEGSDGDGVAVVGVQRWVAPQRRREHVHSIRYRFVHGRQDVGVVTSPGRPAHFVRRYVRFRRSPARCSLRLTQRTRTCITLIVLTSALNRLNMWLKIIQLVA